MEGMSSGRRHSKNDGAGDGPDDPCLTDEAREILRWITTGDLAGEFQAALNAGLKANPYWALGGSVED